MRKIKIFITVLLLYEFAMLTLLQIPHYCFGVFNVSFCSVSFRYFLMCIVVPTLVWLFVWWVPDITKSFCKKCQCENREEKTIKDTTKEIITKHDIERLITAAIVVGAQKFADSHPKTKETLDNILKVISKNKNLIK